MQRAVGPSWSQQPFCFETNTSNTPRNRLSQEFRPPMSYNALCHSPLSSRIRYSETLT